MKISMFINIILMMIRQTKELFASTINATWSFLRDNPICTPPNIADITWTHEVSVESSALKASTYIHNTNYNSRSTDLTSQFKLICMVRWNFKAFRDWKEISPYTFNPSATYFVLNLRASESIVRHSHRLRGAGVSAVGDWKLVASSEHLL